MYSFSIYDPETQSTVISLEESIEDEDVFDTYEEAEEAGLYAISCMNLGAEMEGQFQYDVFYDYEVEVEEV